MEIYTKEELERQKKIKKRAKAAMIIVSAAVLAFCLVMFCTVDPLNEASHRAWTIAAVSAAACFDVYVCSFVLPYLRPDAVSGKKTGKAGRTLRNILRQLLLYVLCVILSAIAVTFIFGRITDTVPAKKVTVYADVRSIRSAELETVLGEDLPEGIKMVKVHSFEYELFGFSGGGADIFIVEKSRAEDFIGNFAPLYDFLAPRDIFKIYEYDGTAYGVLIHSGSAGGAS